MLLIPETSQGMPVARSLLLEFHGQTGGDVFLGQNRGGAHARELLEALGGVEEQMMLGGALLVTPVICCFKPLQTSGP